MVESLRVCPPRAARTTRRGPTPRGCAGSAPWRRGPGRRARVRIDRLGAHAPRRAAKAPVGENAVEERVAVIDRAIGTQHHARLLGCRGKRGGHPATVARGVRRPQHREQSDWQQQHEKNDTPRAVVVALEPSLCGTHRPILGWAWSAWSGPTVAEAVGVSKCALRRIGPVEYGNRLTLPPPCDSICSALPSRWRRGRLA